MAPTNLTRLVKLLVLLSPLAASLTGCDTPIGDSDLAGKSVRYQVEFYGSPQSGTANRALFIRYTTDEGPQEQQDVGLPWTTEVSPKDARFTASVTAQFYGFGTIICRILADNRLVDVQTSVDGPYPTVECRA